MRASESLTMKLTSVIPVSSLLALSLVWVSAMPGRAFAAVANPYAAAEEEPAGFGPLDPTAPANMTPDQIIQKFAAREKQFKTARDHTWAKIGLTWQPNGRTGWGRLSLTLGATPCSRWLELPARMISMRRI